MPVRHPSPDQKFMVCIDGLDPVVAAPACSGVTVSGALKKVRPMAGEERLVIMGCEGSGLVASTVATGPGVANVPAFDIDGAKPEAAGAVAAGILDVSGSDGLERPRDANGGGVRAVIDPVVAGNTSSIGIASPIKGVRQVIVGLFGDVIEPPLPWHAASLLGSCTGSLARTCELGAPGKRGAVPRFPVTTRPSADDGAAPDDLRMGRVAGLTA